uniref:Uncharacterized protein n=1 Tax=Trichobilharzia regenti TaxID=157069 RepID=A0AA85J3G3_TRIRE|nr:unnamed protein product [Trichobilharzia regenti]
MTTDNNFLTIDVVSHGETFHLEGHPCSLSAFSHVPKSRNLPRERTYFNSPEKSHGKTCVYDLVFSKEDDFNPKLHRDDRRHDKHCGLNIYEEEKSKVVPSLSSSIYGHRLNKNIEISDRKHARIMLVESEFYRRNGIDL